GDIIFGDLCGTRHDADHGVNCQCEEHEQIADDLVRRAELLENRAEHDEREEAAGIRSVHPAKLFIEVRFGLSCRSHLISPQSSSAKPNSRSMLSCCFANTNSMTTKMISDPCAAM